MLTVYLLSAVQLSILIPSLCHLLDLSVTTYISSCLTWRLLYKFHPLSWTAPRPLPKSGQLLAIFKAQFICDSSGTPSQTFFDRSKKGSLPYIFSCSLLTTTMVKNKAHSFYYKNKYSQMNNIK